MDHRPKKKARSDSHVWCLTITEFTDDYKHRGEDWSVSTTELFWKKEDAEKRKKHLQIMTIEERVEGSYCEEYDAPMFPDTIKSILREGMKRSWDIKELKQNEKEELWAKTIEKLSKILTELPSDQLTAIYEKVVAGEFVRVIKEMEIEKIEIK
jgi:hypothetical protein